jgi:hypothetical protein
LNEIKAINFNLSKKMNASTATPTISQLWARFNEYLLTNGFVPLEFPEHYEISEIVNEEREDNPEYNNYEVFNNTDLFTELLSLWCEKLNPTLLNAVDYGEMPEQYKEYMEDLMHYPGTGWENEPAESRLYSRLLQYASENPGEIRFE